jgi:hypothetical protein
MSFYKLRLLFIAGLLIFYTVFSRPLIFHEYIPYTFKILIELTPLVLLFFLKKENFFSLSLLLMLSLFLFTLNFFANETSFQLAFSTFLKINFFIILLFLFFNNLELKKNIRRLYVNFWFVVAILTILSSIFYQADKSFFYPFNLEIGKNGYEYMQNFLLGNIRIISSENFSLFKPSWYFYEYGVISGFFTLNFVGSDLLINNKKKSNRFKIANLFAGLATLSITFYIFLFLLLMTNIFRKKSIALVSFVALCIILSFFCYHFDLIDNFFNNVTSLKDRFLRLDIFIDVVKNHPIRTLFIGNGLELQRLGYDRGLSSGWLVFIAERGFIYSLLFFAFLAYLLRRNITIFFAVIYLNLSFDFFLYPLFSLMLALFIHNEANNILYKNSYQLNLAD